MRVNINGAGHQVEIDVDSHDLSYVIEKAQKLWDETRPDRAGPGYAGFQMTQEYRSGHGKFGADFRFGEQPQTIGGERSHG